MHQKPAY